MHIRDITLADVCAGKNWKLVPETDDWFEAPLEDWGSLVEAEQIAPDDHVVYSGLVVYRSGRAKGIVLVRTVSDGDYGGDYCEFVNGAWRQVGLVPNPNAEVGEEFIASPLHLDRSFCGEYDHEHQRQGFQRYVSKLQRDA